MKTLYELLQQAGCEMDNHASDLYVLKTKTSKTIITEFDRVYRQQTGINLYLSTFKESNDPRRREWFEIAFAYAPFWAERNMRAIAISDEQGEEILRKSLEQSRASH